MDLGFCADLLVTWGGEERLVIELKRRLMRQNYVGAVTQVTRYLLTSGIESGILQK